MVLQSLFCAHPTILSQSLKRHYHRVHPVDIYTVSNASKKKNRARISIMAETEADMLSWMNLFKASAGVSPALRHARFGLTNTNKVRWRWRPCCFATDGLMAEQQGSHAAHAPQLTCRRRCSSRRHTHFLRAPWAPFLRSLPDSRGDGVNYSPALKQAAIDRHRWYLWWHFYSTYASDRF